MSGAVAPAASIRRLISGTAAAASGTLTVTRTISEPACASSMHCFAVEATSAVSVLAIDWTTTGAPPPTWTPRSPPTRTPTVAWRFLSLIDPSIYQMAVRLTAVGRRRHGGQGAVGNLREVRRGAHELVVLDGA